MGQEGEQDIPQTITRGYTESNTLISLSSLFLFEGSTNCGICGEGKLYRITCARYDLSCINSMLLNNNCE